MSAHTMPEDGLKPRTDGRCEFDNCEHPNAQYIVTIESVLLDGKREALSCRQHVALVARALSEEVREWIRQGVELAEMDELEEARGASRDREEQAERERAG